MVTLRWHQGRSPARRFAGVPQGPHWSGDALEIFGPKVFKLEDINEKPARSFGNYHGVRLSNPLQACCEIWRLADDRLLLSPAAGWT
jgi:hypothetical protein